MLNELTVLFEKDLLKVKEEVIAFSDEGSLWKNYPGINNCAGNLVLHICGNLQHFIGAILGNTGYKRQRDLEFSKKNVSREEMLADLDKTLQVVGDSLHNLSNDVLNGDYPIPFVDQQVSTKQLLIHLYGHLNYHLGQINYYRRLHS